MKFITVILVILSPSIFVGQTQAAIPKFKNGELVAQRMEKVYNSTSPNSFRSRLRTSGGKVQGNILCAYDGYVFVKCTGTLIVKGIKISAKWELEKRTFKRASLDWVFKGKGVFQSDSEIVAPSWLGLQSF